MISFRSNIFFFLILVACLVVTGTAHSGNKPSSLYLFSDDGQFKTSPVNGQSTKYYTIPNIPVRWRASGTGPATIRIKAAKVLNQYSLGSWVVLLEKQVSALDGLYHNETVQMPEDWDWQLRLEVTNAYGTETGGGPQVWIDASNLPASSISGVPSTVQSEQTISVTVVWPSPLYEEEIIWAGMRSQHGHFYVTRWMMVPIPGGGMTYAQKWTVPAGTTSKTFNVKIPPLNRYESDLSEGTEFMPENVFDVYLQVAKLELPTVITPKTCKITHTPLKGEYAPGSKLNVNFDLGCNLISDNAKVRAAFRGWGGSGSGRQQLFVGSLDLQTGVGERYGKFEVTIPAAGDPYQLCYDLSVSASSIEGGDIFMETGIYYSCPGFGLWPDALQIQAGQAAGGSPSPIITGSMLPAGTQPPSTPSRFKTLERRRIPYQKRELIPYRKPGVTPLPKR